MIKFSIIIPVYNCEDYLKDCINSVLEQSYPLYEIILVDDGSNDNSRVICDRFAECYPDKIIVKHNSNQGPFIARILGIDNATGDILLFLDSDDCLSRDALEILHGYFTKSDCDMVIFNAQESNQFPSMKINHPFEGYSLFEGEGKKPLYKKLIETRALNSICLKAVKRQSAQLLDFIPRSDKLRHGEDLLLSASFITCANKIICIDEGIYHYRIRPGSITHVYSTELKDSIVMVHMALDKFIEIWRLPELTMLHNARKVSGWMDILCIMIRARKEVPIERLLCNIRDMANVQYFMDAYQNMEYNYLSRYYRLLSFLLRKKWCNLLIAVESIKIFVLLLRKNIVLSGEHASNQVR